MSRDVIFYEHIFPYAQRERDNTHPTFLDTLTAHENETSSSGVEESYNNMQDVATNDTTEEDVLANT